MVVAEIFKPTGSCFFTQEVKHKQKQKLVQVYHSLKFTEERKAVFYVNNLRALEGKM